MHKFMMVALVATAIVICLDDVHAQEINTAVLRGNQAANWHRGVPPVPRDAKFYGYCETKGRVGAPRCGVAGNGPIPLNALCYCADQPGRIVYSNARPRKNSNE